MSCSSIQIGSRVAVVAPAGNATAESYRAGLEILAARYRVVHAYDPEREPADVDLPYLAGDDQRRLAALERALADPQVEAVFCARGGYGCTRLLPRLDAALLARPLPVVGFSDVTALLAAVLAAGGCAIHGPVVNQLPRLPPAQLDGLFALVEGRARPRLTGLAPLCPGRARGELAGGNLSLLAALCGTPFAAELAGRVVLLEDVNEPAYRVDRALTQLLQAGGLTRAAGVVVGQLVGCAGDARAVFEDRLGPLRLPVVWGAPCGHCDSNVALPLGDVAVLDAEAGTLTFA